MAIIRGLGYISGKVGDKVYRQINGKTYISELPSKSSKPPTKKMIHHRNRFRFCSQISSALRSLHVLKYFWDTAKPKYSGSLHKLIKYFFTRVGIDFGLTNVELTPSVHFLIEIDVVDFSREKIIIRTKSLDPFTGIYIPREPTITAQGLLCLENSSFEDKERFCFIPLSFPDLDTVFTAMTFERELTELQSQKFDLYPFKTLLFCFATKNPEKRPIQVSTSIIIKNLP